MKDVKIGETQYRESEVGGAEGSIGSVPQWRKKKKKKRFCFSIHRSLCIATSRELVASNLRL